MSSYVVTGASRGLGLEFVRQFSENPTNIVIALCRDGEEAGKKLAAELGRTNVHVVQGDIGNYETLRAAAVRTSRITGGKLDYLIANAGHEGGAPHLNIGDFTDAQLEKELTDPFRINVIGNAQLINAFLPLVLIGSAKKVFVMSTAMGDSDFVKDQGVWSAVPYAVSKAALNMIIAKFDAAYRDKGILFMAISPGVVDTQKPPSEEVAIAARALVGHLAKYAPDWKGPLTPKESVELVISVMERSNVGDDHAGVMLSHFGNKQFGNVQCS